MKNLATPLDLNTVINIFKQHKKIFPHIRIDYIKSMIEKGNCVLDNGVVIMFLRYKRHNRIGTIRAPKDSYTIKQIVNSMPGNGNASDVMNKFLEQIDEVVFLSVRADNIRAIKFYENNEFVSVGTINWKQGIIPGIVFARKAYGVIS